MENELLSAIRGMLKEELQPINTRLDSMDEKIQGLDVKVNSMDKKIQELDGNVSNMDGKIQGLDEKMQKMDTKIDKNTILLEELTTKIEIVAEVQKSHMEQNTREHNEIVDKLEKRFDVLESAVKDVSTDVRHIEKDLLVLEEITAKNYSDIIQLRKII